MEQPVINLLMEKITFFGTFDQYNYISGKDNFVELWDKLNFDLYQTNKDFLMEIPVSVLTITTLQSSINLVLGLRTLYSKNRQRINLNFITDTTEYYNIQLLPESHIEVLEYTWSFMVSKLAQEETPYAGFTHLEISKLEYYINYMQTESKHTPSEQKSLQQKFYKHVRDNDFANNKNFCAIFPDMKDYFNLCEKLYYEQQVN